ncbi:MAG TPA: beta-ketoacyl-ACP synthase [Myxococcota bacterium]|nr:beta-ketoacyl-ACP synthase [Myxococcota bacterium]
MTGMAGISPLGSDWKSVSAALRAGVSAVERVPELAEISGMRTQLAARVRDFVTPGHYDRKRTRSMGRVALLAARATELALLDAGMLGDPALADGSMGISYGSTSGSPPAVESYARKFMLERTLSGIRPNDYVQHMSHTVAANLAQFFGVRGRIQATCTACTSGSQGIGYAFEAIRYGLQEGMIAGGAEEYHALGAAVFDVLYATSARNHEPARTPRPFDAERDGLVVGEGAATFVLESLERARARGARIHAEIVGFGTNCDGKHITNPDAEGMQRVMELALRDAQLPASAIGYVNAHATATEAGDIAESHATAAAIGTHTPISSLKGALGHTLGACGALEAWLTIEMQREGWFAPTLNLERVDERCAPLDYIAREPRRLACELAMSNNFAFGGVNTSLIFRRFDA